MVTSPFLDYNMLKPTAHEIQLVYNCPKCQFRHWRTYEQVTQPNQTLNCHCGCVSKITMVTNVEFRVETKESEENRNKVKGAVDRITKSFILSENKKKNFLSLSKSDIKKASSLIVAQGYPVKVCMFTINKVMEAHSLTDWKELVRLSIALLGGKNEPQTN